MRIVCPSCAAEYEVPSANLRPHRKVRCTRCGGQWVPVQEAQTEAPPAGPPAGESPLAVPTLAPPRERPDPAGPTGMDRLAATATAPPGSIALRAAWVATLLLLVGSAGACVIWRGKVVQLWPASARVLGVAHPAPVAAGPQDQGTPPVASDKP